MFPSVSVIIAVYNAELYLSHCLNSIVNQTLKNIEIILVDDGSTDSSGKLCEEFAMHDHRIHVFHKENEGVGITREFGNSHAIGEYFIHVDPDDWVEDSMLEDLYNEATQKQADVVICDFYEEGGNEHLLRTQSIPMFKNEKVLKAYLYGKLHGSCCNKLIKRKTWVNLGVHFPPINFCEDLYVNVKLALFPIRYAYINKAYYHYIHHENHSSLTSFNNSITGENAYQACLALKSLLLNTDYWQTFVETEMKLFSFLVLYHGTLSAKEYKDLFKPLRKQGSLRWDVRLSLYSYGIARFIVKKRHLIAILWYHVRALIKS